MSAYNNNNNNKVIYTTQIRQGRICAFSIGILNEEESFQFILNMSSYRSGERSTTTRLDCLVPFVRHLLMFENFKNFEKFKTLIHN